MAENKIDLYQRTPINPNRMTVKNEVLNWGHQVLIGKFRLGGNNPITQRGLWPLIQKIRSETGWGALTKLAGDIYRVATINNLTTNDTGEVESIKVQYVNQWGGTSSKGSSDQGEELTNEKDFVIFKNNPDKIPNFSTSQRVLNFLDEIYKASIFDLEVSRPRLFIETHFYPTEIQKQRIRQNVDAYNMIVYASLGDGKPMTFHPWMPESKQPVLKNMWDWQFGLFRRFNGIAYNTSKKEERHNVAEVRLVEEQFESFENIWQQELEYFLRKCYENFGGEEYILIKDKEEVFRIGDLVEKQELEKKKPPLFNKKEEK